MTPYLPLSAFFLSIFGQTVSQLVYHGTDANIEDALGIFDDSLGHTLQLEPLRLRIVPTPVLLDVYHSNILLNDIEDMVSHHFRVKNQEGFHLGKFRFMEFGTVEGTHFEPGDDALNSPPATLVSINGIDVSFMDEIPDKNVVMKNLQEFINQHDFGENTAKMGGQTTAQKGSDNGFATDAVFEFQTAIKSIKLTWSSQGYTLAPSPSPVFLSTRSPTVDGTDDILRDDPTKGGSIRYPLMAGCFVMVALSLLLVKRYKSNRQSSNGSITSNLRRFPSRRNEFDGLDFLHPPMGLGSENGGFPMFSPHQCSNNIKVHFVDLDNQPISPKDIGEIVLADSVSDISSLGQSENRIVVTYPIHSSGGGAKGGFPITNLTRVGHTNGPWALYHETQEGFDRLHDDDEWVSNHDTNLHNVPQLLRSNEDSLRYSSDTSSLDIDPYLADQEVNRVDNHDPDLNVSPNKNTLSATMRIWLPESIRRLRRGQTVENDGLESDQGDDHSSVGGLLRSVV